MVGRGGRAGGQVRAPDEEVATGSRVEEENPTEPERSGRDNTQTRLLKGKHVSDAPRGAGEAACPVGAPDRSGRKVCLNFREPSAKSQGRFYRRHTGNS